MKFSVAILGRARNQHAACFEEVASALAGTLRDLGHDVVDFGQGGRLIVFGAGNNVPVDDTVPDDSIIFNAEQLTQQGDVYTQLMPEFDKWAKRCVIWDFSQTNAEKLRALGAPRVAHCPIGYHERMSTFVSAPPEEQDIDVLFYGAMNARRREIIDELDHAGIEVAHLFGVYGKERDKIIARAKVVLNLHFYDKAVFEIFRVSHLVANKKFVVSEGGGTDPGLEKVGRRITDLVERDDIVPTVLDVLEQPGFRNEIIHTAHNAFRKIPFADGVRAALEQS